MRGKPGGDLEFSLLVELWDHDGTELTARHIHDRLGRARGIVYTTVAKALDRLVDKGLVDRRRAGHIWLYKAAVRRVETQRAMARELIEQILGDDPKPAAAALAGAVEDVSSELLRQLEAELKARKE